jgi:hypothetical protein
MGAKRASGLNVVANREKRVPGMDQRKRNNILQTVHRLTPAALQGEYENPKKRPAPLCPLKKEKGVIVIVLLKKKNRFASRCKTVFFYIVVRSSRSVHFVRLNSFHGMGFLMS